MKALIVWNYNQPYLVDVYESYTDALTAYRNITIRDMLKDPKNRDSEWDALIEDDDPSETDLDQWWEGSDHTYYITDTSEPTGDPHATD